MWLKNFRFSKKIEILNDGTVSNVDRLGAIRDIEFVITRKRINCNLLIIAGDNLFENSLQDFVRFSQRKIPSMSIGLYDVRDKELAKKFGVVEIDKDNQIIDFQEKPLLPKSSLVAKCLYFFPKEKIGLINQYLKEDKNVKDAPGYYIEWLVKREKVFGFVFRGRWYDIGDISSYEEAKQAYEK
jgi:glucose-1-phosphate thymidylyltransferase